MRFVYFSPVGLPRLLKADAPVAFQVIFDWRRMQRSESIPARRLLISGDTLTLFLVLVIAPAVRQCISG